MTLVEFFDRDDVENVCSAFAGTPDRVLLLGKNLKLMKRRCARYAQVLEERGVKPEFVCRALNVNNLSAVTDALCRVVEEYGDCVVDLTGGEDLYLVAAGVVSERFRDKNVQMHRFNVKNNTVTDVDADGVTLLSCQAPRLSVEENVKIYGGDVKYGNLKRGATVKWELTDPFKADINAMWDICRRDPRLWNNQIAVLDIADSLSDSRDPLHTRVAASRLGDAAEDAGVGYVASRRVLSALEEAGLITDFSADGGVFELRYKDPQIKYCLNAAGQALEMKIYLAALEATDDKGEKVYNDALNGVCIDWDGEFGEDAGVNTANEIDVMMMRGMVPVFVSCKNGRVDMNELYKLDSVASRFGGKYAKKVLVASSLEDGSFAESLRQRAGDMGIRIVEGYSRGGHKRALTQMTDAELNRVVRSLWSN